MTLREDIAMLNSARVNCHVHPEEREGIANAIAVLSPLAAMPPEQIDAMLVQTTQLRVSWLQAAAHALTDEENRRAALISEGYQALAEALRAVKS